MKYECSYISNNHIGQLVGKTLISIIKKGDYEIRFYCADGDAFVMHHHNDCCESVSIDDICGNLDNLIGSPVITAREKTNRDETPEDCKLPDPDWKPESYTWTFYDIATEKGFVTIRWFGESNGYYSEDVDFCQITKGAQNAR